MTALCTQEGQQRWDAEGCAAQKAAGGSAVGPALLLIASRNGFSVLFFVGLTIFQKKFMNASTRRKKKTPRRKKAAGERLVQRCETLNFLTFHVSCLRFFKKTCLVSMSQVVRGILPIISYLLFSPSHVTLSQIVTGHHLHLHSHGLQHLHQWKPSICKLIKHHQMLQKNDIYVTCDRRHPLFPKTCLTLSPWPKSCLISLSRNTACTGWY